MRYLRPGALCAALVLTGCGSSAPRAPVPSSAPVLVVFQRNGGLAATLDKLTVRKDGRAQLDKRYGGAGRRRDAFRLAPAMLTRLREGLARLPAHFAPHGTPTPQGATFLLRYGGRSYSAREGAVGRAGRPAFAALNAIVDGTGRAR